MTTYLDPETGDVIAPTPPGCIREDVQDSYENGGELVSRKIIGPPDPDTLETEVLDEWMRPEPDEPADDE